MITMQTFDPLLTVEQVAEWLAVSHSYIRQHVSGKNRPFLPGIKIGQEWRFEKSAIEQWIREQANYEK
jgi:excisionase family DNA binding protein